MKIAPKYIPFFAFTVFAFGIFLGKYLNFPTHNNFLAKNNHKDKINKLLDFINNEYVDNVNTDSIVDLTVDNILSKLDPHSVYISSKDQVVEAQSMKGNFVGIGVNFYLLNDTIMVVKPTEKGPAEKAGLLPGDRILCADNFKLYGKKITAENLFSKLKGAENSKVELTVFRKKTKQLLKFKVTRAVVALKSVETSVLLTPTTGYIKINRFAESTYTEFKAALTQLQQQNITALVVDLRGNGGGYMEKAVEIADEFLKDKQLIVFTKNKKGKIDKTFATKKGSFETGKVFVLIDENSASASEILAGALQDNDRGTLIGRRSFGKGLVQREMDFEDGSAVRLTIARYFTPTGRSIQKPYNKGHDAYFKEFEKRFDSGELFEKDSVKVNDSLKYKTPRGRLVYGGGGIVPDIFVPLEGERGEESITYLLESGIVGHFVFEQIDSHPNDYVSLSLDKIKEKVNHSNQYYTLFQKYLNKSGVTVNCSKSKKLLNRYLIAELAKQLLGDAAYFKTILADDKMIKAALEK